jgi:HAD superfamily hydrolase (TIGR01549 family)
MPPARIRAVTFDLWDTVLVDDSDEPKRKNMGLLPKPQDRRRLVLEFLEKHAPVSVKEVNAAYDAVDSAFNHTWHQEHITWTVTQRLTRLLSDLNRDLPENELSELVRLHEEMELGVRPDLAPGAREALQALRGSYRLGVISDTIFSSGRTLRRILEAEGLLDLFDACVFSDEVGRSKPDRLMFETAAELLGIDIGELVHVGDREQNDVAGPQAIGARAILVTVVKDRRAGPSKADAICKDYRELPRLVDSLNAGGV